MVARKEQIGASQAAGGLQAASPLVQAISRRLQVSAAQGSEILDDGEAGFSEAVAAAQESDVVVLTLGGGRPGPQ